MAQAPPPPSSNILLATAERMIYSAHNYWFVLVSDVASPVGFLIFGICQHRLRRVLMPGLNAIDLRDFENTEGVRWVPATMRVDGVGISASLHGERCELEHSF